MEQEDNNLAPNEEIRGGGVTKFSKIIVTNQIILIKIKLNRLNPVQQQVD